MIKFSIGLQGSCRIATKYFAFFGTDAEISCCDSMAPLLSDYKFNHTKLKN
jgi:hypothetical protein